MTACTSTECPMKKECYRANSNTNEHHDCFNYEYGCNENSGFQDFVSVKWYRNIVENTGGYEWKR